MASDPLPAADAPTTRSPALSLLRDLSAAVPKVARWRHWVLRIDAMGRVTLPAAARPGGGVPVVVRAASRGQALLLRPDGLGAACHLDDRWRLMLPGWLRRSAGPGGTVLVAASVPDARAVVVAPAAVLDVLVDGLDGEVG